VIFSDNQSITVFLVGDLKMADSPLQDQDKYASGSHAQAFNRMSDDAGLILDFTKANTEVSNVKDYDKQTFESHLVPTMKWMLDNADGLFKALKGREEEAADMIANVGFTARINDHIDLENRAADIMEEHALKVVRADPDNPDALRKGIRILEGDFFRAQDIERSQSYRENFRLPPSRRQELGEMFYNRLNRILGTEDEAKYGLPPVNGAASQGPAPRPPAP
jgi:hypothetical protein